MTVISNDSTSVFASVGRTLRNFGIALLVLGLAAMALPQAATLATELLVGLVLLFSGVLGIVLTASAKGALAGVFSWGSTGAAAVLSLLTGLLLLVAPSPGALVLTAVLVGLFFVEGLLYITLSLRLGRRKDAPTGASWLIVNGATSLLVGMLILLGWPDSASWAIGLLVGLKLVMTGITLFIFGRAVKSTAVSSV